APELQKLKYFVGTWKMEGEAKPGPMGPGGKFTSTERSEWMPGGFFVVNHGTGSMPGMGKMISTAYMGYNPEEKVYTYNEFNNMGAADVAKGTVEGDTWTFTDENKMQGKVVKGRYIMKVTSPTSYDFKYEASMDGGPYDTVMEGKATKAGAAAAGKSGEKGSETKAPPAKSGETPKTK
ncbi:MAG TPA: DUF1579 family protein, partial [Candidatus Sulfotelmatobacter sp.]|nr:DUF1579 family protein [Candidatus Sulfotelmatobacter sp.]